MAKEYRVSVDDDFISPEETLLDTSSEFSDLERPISANAFRFLFWGIAVFLAIVFAASVRLSIFQYSYFSSIAVQNRSANFLVSAPRGIIYDSSGQPLVNNVASFDLIAVTKEIKPALAAGNPAIAKAAAILKMAPADLTAALTTQSKTANIFPVVNDLTKDQVLSMQYLNPPGLYIIPDVKRSYVDGPEFSQIVGYVGKVSAADLTNDSYYTSTDVVGRLGIEAQYEDELRGQHGRIFFGDTADTMDTGATSGNSVVLNIDSNLQRELYTQLQSTVAAAGLSRAAAIVQNPQTGAVLAMVSLPSFDSNAFTGGLSQSEYDSIFNNPARPLFNRVISGQYNPGSTIKPLMGLMGLQEGVITPDTTIQNCISITIPNPFSGTPYVFKNWRVDLGPFNLRRSIANSCNVFFATVGGGFGNISGLGIARMVKYFTEALIDKTLGIDLPGEAHGFVPTPAWYKATTGQDWYQGNTYNTSIGQGDLLVTPLWLNSYISAIANGGTIYKPEVAARIVDGQMNPITVFQPSPIEKLPFSDANLAIIKSDMQETILSGTATLLKDLPVTAGGKTGTAQVINGQQINSLFTIFAPFDHPQITMTVLIENPTDEGLAIRVANNVLKWYFAQTATASR